MKPSDHPDFFRLPPPPGRSRESTIRLEADGTFTHDGEPVVHPGLAQAMHTWIRRHPDDGRFILENGYDWTYFTVVDAPFTVRGVHARDGGLLLELSDGSLEAWVPAATRIGPDGALYAQVKRDARVDASDGAPMEAKFTRHSQTALEPFLVEVDGRAGVRVGAKVEAIGP